MVNKNIKNDEEGNSSWVGMNNPTAAGKSIDYFLFT
jgi:hypothetical protein